MLCCIVSISRKVNNRATQQIHCMFEIFDCGAMQKQQSNILKIQWIYLQKNSIIYNVIVCGFVRAPNAFDLCDCV